MRYTSNELITQMRLNSSTPNAQTKFNDARCLNFLNEELTLTVQAKLLELRADFFVKSTDIPLVASTSQYDLPERAVGWSLYDWGYVDVNGDYRSLSQTSVPYLERYSETATYDYPSMLYIEDEKLKTRPKISASPVGSIRVFFEKIQSELVLTSACGLISSVVTTPTTYQITVDSIPVYSAGVDIVSGVNPYGIIGEDITPSSVAGLIITVPITSFSRAPVAGDYVCPAGKTCIPHIPDIAMPILAQAGTIRVLEASNDIKGLEAANITMARFMTALTERCRDRVKARPKKVLPKNYLLNMVRR